MPRLRIVEDIVGTTVEKGLVVESPGPVSDLLHDWLLAGVAELINERVEVDDDGQVAVASTRQG